ncbi:RluA family pseudouridine synthase [Urechidicola croceus]|uniref:RNA pseudouridine synthase n=1 Tax=Urechidicola croceus TaxID=1850246 RepID=A0A1D8P665_9FLAO|nr:RluA family pseudouridine synthase [Urechidicola croceus]AOW20064.1 RNA pseudouridine synthase [Urechidicola croceus]
MKLIESHIVPSIEKPIRIQEYAVGIFTTISTKSAIKKALKKGLIKVNDGVVTTAKYIVGGETISLFEIEQITTQKKLKLKLEVIFEDDYLAIVYKPAGILVSGNKFKTISNALIQNLKKSIKIDAVKPQPVHRLDYPTTGLLLIGKTSSSILKLNKLFENKEIQKVYHAITIGDMKSSGSVDFTIDKKESFSYYKVLNTVPSERFKCLNLVKLTPKTGRKHQLRKHLSAIGNPILGDKLYGKDGFILNGKGLYLHAYSLEFEHPFTKEKMYFHKDNPKNFDKIFT